jgi:PAS domain S-box-containing protein
MKKMKFNLDFKRGNLKTITLLYAILFFILVFFLSDLFVENVLSNTKLIFLIQKYRIWLFFVASVALVYYIFKIQTKRLINSDVLLKQTEDTYQVLVENLKEDYFFYRHDKDQVFQNISKSIKNILGYTPNDFRENFLDYNGEDLSGVYIKKHLTLIENGLKSPPFETEVIDSNGEKRILEVKEIPILDENGSIVGIEGLARDITNYKRFEYKLKDKDNKFQTLFESANDAILMIKGNKIVDCNSKALEMFQCSFDQIIMQEQYSYKFSPPIQINGKSSKEEGREKSIKALEGNPQFFEWMYIRINGEKFDAEVSLNRFVFEDDYYLQAIIRDISLRKRAEMSLLESEEYYKNLYETSVVGLYRTRINDGKIIYGNKVAANILGFQTINEAIDTDFKVNSLYSADRREEMLSELNEHGYIQDFEIHQKFIDGRENYISISAKIFPEKNFIEGTVFEITKRKKAELELEENEKKFKEILDNSRAILYKLNASDGSYSYISPTCYNILGFYPDEMLKMDIDQQKALLHPDDLGRATNIIAKLITSVPKNKSSYTIEYRLKHKKGGYRWLSDSYKVVKNEINKTAFIIGNIIDITEERESRFALKESELRFRNMAENIKNGITINEHGYNVYVNDRLSEITGYSNEELLSFSEFQISAPEEKKRLQTIVLGLQKTNKNLEEIEFWIVRKDGSRRCILNRYAYNYFEDDKLVKYIITTDITDRKLMENTLRESEEKFKELANTLPQTLFESDLKGQIIYANKAGLNLFGFQDEDLKNGINIFDIVTPEQKDEAQTNYSNLIEGKTYEQLEYDVCRKDGTIFHIILYPSLMYNKDEEVIGVRGIIIEASNQKRIQEELNIAKEAVEAVSKSKSIFLTHLTHELRTPMNSIYGMTELIKRTALTDKQYDFLKIITESSENLLSILNDILIIPKIESGQISFYKKAFKMQDVLTSVAGLVSYQAELKKLKIIETQKFNDDLVVIGDPSRLNQILINFVEYSIKNTDNGNIELKIETVEENNDNINLKFSITDSSKGVPKKIIDALSKDFETTHLDIYSEYGSYGLGFIIANKLISLLGSTLSVKSNKDGMYVSFLLRLRKADLSQLDEQSKLAEDDGEKSLKNVRILLVEDELFNQLVIRSMVEEWDCEIDSVYSGKDALQKLEKNIYDVVLMDVQMPEMDGVETTKMLRKSSEMQVSKLPVIAITTNIDSENQEMFKKAGMNYAISKPFKSKELFHVLVRGLGIKDKEEEVVTTAKPEISEVEDASKLYDLRIIKNISKNNNLLVIKMVKVFVDKTKEEIKDLSISLEKEDWNSISNITHKMKPASSYMGIKNIEDIISNIHIYCKEEKNLDKVPEMIKKLISILEKVIDTMNKDIVVFEKEE